MAQASSPSFLQGMGTRSEVVKWLKHPIRVLYKARAFGQRSQNGSSIDSEVRKWLNYPFRALHKARAFGQRSLNGSSIDSKVIKQLSYPIRAHCKVRASVCVRCAWKSKNRKLGSSKQKIGENLGNYFYQMQFFSNYFPHY